MTIGDEIRDEKLQHYIKREAAKNQHCHLVKLINIDILLSYYLIVNKYYLPIKVE